MCDCDIPKRYKKRLLPLNPANDQLPIYNHVLGKWQLINKADIGGGGSTAFNGNRAIKRSPSIGLNVGGTTTVEFLNNYFFPASPAGFAMSNLGITYYESGYWAAAGAAGRAGMPNYLNGAVIPNDATDIQWRLYNNIAGTAYPDNSAPFNAMPFTTVALPNILNTNSAYSIQISFKLNGVLQPYLLSGIKYRTWITPYFYGMVDAGTFDLPTTKQALITAGLNSVLQPFNSTMNLIFNGTDKHIIVAYPASYGNLFEVKDQNNFNLLGGWTKIEGNINGFGDPDNPYGSTAYKLYYSDVTTVNGSTYILKRN